MIVYYEGLARPGAAGLLPTFGIADLCFGLVRVFGLPLSLGRTHRQMLLDQRRATEAG